MRYVELAVVSIEPYKPYFLDHAALFEFQPEAVDGGTNASAGGSRFHPSTGNRIGIYNN